MPHVLFTTDFLDPDNIGGSGRVILEVGSRLALQGYRVSVLAGGHRRGRWLQEYRGASLDWVSFPYPIAAGRSPRSWWESGRAARAALRGIERPDLFVHSQPLTAWLLGVQSAPSAYLFHSPWSLEFRAEADARSPATRRLAQRAGTWLGAAIRERIEARVVRRALRVLTLSETMKQHALALHGIPEELVSVRPGSADLERFAPISRERRAAVRNRLGVPAEATMVVCVRRLIARTGVDLLIEALDRMAHLRPQLHVLIAGRGHLEAELRALGEALVRSGRLRFLGYVPEADLSDLYGAADAAIMPTRSLEGFGLATLEALSCGTPVLATPVGGSVEILAGLDPTLLAGRVDSRAVADLLLDWTSRPDRLADLRPRCSVHAREGYDWQSLVDGLTEVLAGLGRPVHAANRLTARV